MTQCEREVMVTLVAEKRLAPWKWKAHKTRSTYLIVSYGENFM